MRNNLLMHGRRAFASHDHQGATRDLVFVHNTLINRGDAAELRDWNGRPGMVFANNAVVSERGAAVAFSRGSSGVDLAGNVHWGPVVGAAQGFRAGLGPDDFRALDLRSGPDWARRCDARPSPEGTLPGAAAESWSVQVDLTGRQRSHPMTAGCYDASSTTQR